MAEKAMNRVRDRMEKPVGYTVTALDARESTCHVKESNYGNFVCDLMRLYYDTDVALMTGGTIMGDQVHTTGMIRLRFITDSFPFEDPVVVIRVSGKDIWQALENGLHAYPNTEGFFLQVSGMAYSFNPNAKPWAQVQDVNIGGKEIDLEKKYTVACRSRIAFGQDGFESLRMTTAGGGAEEVIADEYGLLIFMILRQYFMSLQVLSGMSKFSWGVGMASTWGSINAQMNQIHPVRECDKIDPTEHDPANKGNVDDYGSDDDDAPTPGTQESIEHGRKLSVMRKTLRKWRKCAGLKGDAQLPTYEEEKYEADWTKGICPQLERRITMTEELAA